MPNLNSISSQSPLGRFVHQVKAAHAPAPSSPGEALKQDAISLTLGASGGVLGFTGLKLAQGSFNSLSYGSFALPAATGAVAGLISSQMSDNAVAKVAIGAATGAATGLLLNRLGLAPSHSVLSGALAGAGGSAMNALLPSR